MATRRCSLRLVVDIFIAATILSTEVHALRGGNSRIRPLQPAKPLPQAIPRSTELHEGSPFRRLSPQTLWPAPYGQSTPAPVALGEPCGGRHHHGPTNCSSDPFYNVDCVAVPEHDRDFDISTCRRITQTSCSLKSYTCIPPEGPTTCSAALPLVPSIPPDEGCLASCACAVPPPKCPPLDCSSHRCPLRDQLPYTMWPTLDQIPSTTQPANNQSLAVGWLDQSPFSEWLSPHQVLGFPQEQASESLCPRCACFDTKPPCPEPKTITCPHGATTTYAPLAPKCSVLMCRRCKWWERCAGRLAEEEVEITIGPTGPATSMTTY